MNRTCSEQQSSVERLPAWICGAAPNGQATHLQAVTGGTGSRRLIAPESSGDWRGRFASTDSTRVKRIRRKINRRGPHDVRGKLSTRIGA
jgi:hypothetical protein